MPVEYGTYNNPELQDGALIAQEGDAWLITDIEQEGDEISLSEIDTEPGRVRIHTPGEEDEIGYTDMAFDELRMARLAFGLWIECGPFNEPEGRAIPVEVATEGQEAIAAYLRIGDGYPQPRSYVAEKMDVTEQTVSNYCNRVRWSP